MRLYGVRQLDEMGGRFYVHVRCRSCQRRTCFLASELATRVPGADLDVVKEKLKCAECGARRPWVWAAAERMEDDDQAYDFLIDFG